jgi:uncharacterized protein (DUF362 family)
MNGFPGTHGQDLAVGIAAMSRAEAEGGDAYAIARVVSLVREALLQAGLGRIDRAAPLRDVVPRGATVLVKPNWVLHENKSGHGMDCMVAHPAVLAAVLREVVAAGAGRIVVGDAPIQSCLWDELVTPRLQQVLRAVASPVPVRFADFRRTRTLGATMSGGVEVDARGEENYALFDLAGDSLLEPLSTADAPFRITSYDPAKLAQTHRPGRHQYLLAREAFDADVVISVPKLKTHRKSGLTAALKNLVGMNGNKDFLPHHRVGGSEAGGDCYEGGAPWKRAAEAYLDLANARVNTPEYDFYAQKAWRLIELFGRHDNPDVEGAWHGNDTLWRTVLDLNRILVYGRADGTMADAPQRTLFSLTDAIVCGEGEGPLAPTPLAIGVITFSACAAWADAAHGALLGIDADRTAVIREAFGTFRWPLAPAGRAPEVALRGRRLTPRELAAELGRPARLPRGWAGHCELAPATPPPGSLARLSQLLDEGVR